MAYFQLILFLKINLPFKQETSPLIHKILQLIKLLNELQLLVLKHLLQFLAFQLHIISLLQPNRIINNGLLNNFGSFELLGNGRLIVLETNLTELLLNLDLLAGRAQEVQLDAVEVAWAF
jgi:hypothetical protein